MKGRISEYVSLSLLQKLSNTYFISEFYFQNAFYHDDVPQNHRTHHGLGNTLKSRLQLATVFLRPLKGFRV